MSKRRKILTLHPLPYRHLTASYGSYLLCVLVAYDRKKMLGKRPILKWIFYILPFVQLPSRNINENDSCDKKKLFKNKKELLYDESNLMKKFLCWKIKIKWL